VSETSCPPRELLEGLALGHEPPAAIGTHVAACEACRAALERIREDNAVLAGFAVGGVLPRPRNAVPAIPGYEIAREIHRGGQGVVYLARQRSTHRDVAVKVMRQGPFATPADRSRFEREIETLSRLDHPNIVTVHDAGLADGFHYFVMNYVDGLALDDWAAQLGEPDSAATHAAPSPGADRARIESILRAFLKVCDAVHAAHLRGVIHRDLKPSNICVDRAGEPHVLDFGLAKATDDRLQSNMTRTGQFVGSLPWASPEQVEGASRSVDLRTDVYSLGAILYQLLSGAPPFDPGKNLHDLLDDILHREPARPGSVVRSASSITGSTSSRSFTLASRRGLDDELDTIVLKCLAKDPARRYQSAGELASDLRRYGAGEAIEARRDSMLYVLRKTLRRYRMRVAAGSAFVVLLAVFAVVMAILYQQSSVLERRASDAADSLDVLLSQSNIHQGRMAGIIGDLASAEQLLWSELLTRRVPGQDPPIRVNDPPGPQEGWWALWDLYRRFRLERTILLDYAPFTTPTIDADARSIWLAQADGAATQFDLTGAPLQRLPFAPPARLSGGALNESLNTLLRFEGERFVAWRRGGEPPLNFRTETAARPDALAVSGSGRLAAEAYADRVTVWQLPEANVLTELVATGSDLCAAAISPDERWIAARSRLGEILVWDVASGGLRASVPSPYPDRDIFHTAGALLFSDDARYLADAWWENPGQIVDLSAVPPRSIRLADSAATYRTLAFSPDAALLAVGDQNGILRLFETSAGTCVAQAPGHAERILSIRFTPDGRRVITADVRAARIWTAAPEDGARAWSVSGERFHSAALGVDERSIIAGGALGSLACVDRHTGGIQSRAFGSDQLVSSIAISPVTGRLAVATFSQFVYLWPSASIDGAPTHKLQHPRFISHITFSDDGGRLASAADDGVIRVWSAESGALQREWNVGPLRIPQIAFDPRGRQIAAGLRDGSLQVWDLDRDERRQLAPPDSRPLRAVQYIRDGAEIIAGGAGRTLDTWDVAGGQRVSQRGGHQAEIYCLDDAPRQQLIATGDSAGVILLWNRDCERPLLSLNGHTESVMALQFADDGAVLISVGLDGMIREWDLTRFAPHIAGQVDAQLRALNIDALDPPRAAAWRAWAAEVLASAPDASP